MKEINRYSYNIFLFFFIIAIVFYLLMGFIFSYLNLSIIELFKNYIKLSWFFLPISFLFNKWIYTNILLMEQESKSIRDKLRTLIADNEGSIDIDSLYCILDTDYEVKKIESKLVESSQFLDKKINRSRNKKVIEIK